LSGNNAQETVMQSPVEGSGVTADADDIPEPVWNYEHCPKTSSIQSVAALKDSETEWLHAVACADQEQSYAKAFSLLRTRLAITPQDPAALYWSVRVMRHSAFSALAQVTNIDPTSIQLHLLLAHILLDQEKLQPAEVEYRKVLDRDPLAIQAHLGLAMAEYRSRDFEAAIPELQKVLSLAPRDSEANYLLGSILILQQQYDRAKPLLIQAKKSASATNAVPIHARLAEAYAETGDLPGAIKELKSCLSADIDGRYHYRLSLLYRKLGDRAAADAALRKYSELRNNTELAESIAEIQ
jgi:tetratricopeptide (TPR) repeat protein